MYFVLRSSSSGNNIIFFDIACSLDTAYFIDFSFLLVAESNEAHFFSACGNTYFETVHKLYPFKQMIFTDPDLDQFWVCFNKLEQFTFMTSGNINREHVIRLFTRRKNYYNYKTHFFLFGKRNMLITISLNFNCQCTILVTEIFTTVLLLSGFPGSIIIDYRRNLSACVLRIWCKR